jgi:excisionase family DNA binding protein
MPKPEARSPSSALLCYNDREAARLLGISPRTVFAMRKSGLLPHVRIGRGRIVIRHGDLEKFLEEHRVGGNHDAE